MIFLPADMDRSSFADEGFGKITSKSVTLFSGLKTRVAPWKKKSGSWILNSRDLRYFWKRFTTSRSTFSTSFSDKERGVAIRLTS